MEIQNNRVLLRGKALQDFSGPGLSRLKVERRWLRWQLAVDRTSRYKGLSKPEARELARELARLVDVHEEESARRARQMALEMLRDGLSRELEELLTWRDRVEDFFLKAQSTSRWIARDQLKELLSERPDLSTLLHHPSADLEDALSETEVEALRSVRAPIWTRRARVNKLIEANELAARKDFLDRIEKSPLTTEQARAVIRLDNRVQVVAAAGSGKTSVMVARAAYAVMRGFVPAERILVLAFNASAAKELQERIAARFKAAGIDSTGLHASTFHAFGLSVIGQATGRKPRLAPWLESGRDLEKVERIVDQLRDEAPAFRLKWDLFRLLFAKVGERDADWWDPATKVVGHRTFRGETVRSAGEKAIADFLFLCNVNYEYERPYAHDVASPDHSQYRPDFYYPDVDLWHEHWAVGADGRVPAEFVGYEAGMEWKREIHQTFGTALLETTWGEILDEHGLEDFAAQLRRHGLSLDTVIDDPDRHMPGAQPVKNADLSMLIRTFMSHVKSNSLDRTKLRSAIASLPMGPARYRAQMFADLYWQVHDRWQGELAAHGYVDFEDMLIEASRALDRGAAISTYDMVLVDEFQDSSSARARLVGSLVHGEHKYLMTVGDDWQSIYRFAGSDMGVMTDFERWFGKGETLKLETTFRSSQEITDVASAFVSKNPRQIPKSVTAAQGPSGTPVRLARIAASDLNRPEPELAEAVATYLTSVSTRLAAGQIAPGPNGGLTIDVLGRYGFESDLLPRRPPPGIDVQFRTVHAAKGLEADYVLIPRLVGGTVGFPSLIDSDPLLDLVMPNPDPFPFGEERRLFYVALTRARREVAILTVVGRESPFVVELMAGGLVTLVGEIASGEAGSGLPPTPCPKCGQGLLRERTGRHGVFVGCTRFPTCTFTRNRGDIAVGVPPF
ncbi:UvrD-helicase domain-containing protein [Nocardioides sp. J2M5]|uniref:UvrD-helicase domain-containing protein n=1 Tax=Nocardioides palaemonis TaxID=2829810 RepID=UPI001BA6EDDA|nr:UvrD-helicase domain-containing protein [Nocardioides palaemonis]MBS2936576.1 UvrD-helicase domain-containing protein [Nocardioides palaemonis]